MQLVPELQDGPYLPLPGRKGDDGVKGYRQRAGPQQVRTFSREVVHLELRMAASYCFERTLTVLTKLSESLYSLFLNSLPFDESGGASCAAKECFFIIAQFWPLDIGQKATLSLGK